MKTKMLITVAFLLCHNLVVAGAPPSVPIDGGLSILLAIGAAFGLKKFVDHRKNQ